MVLCMAVWCIPGMTLRSICMHIDGTRSDNAYGLLRHAAFTPVQRVWHCTGVEEEDFRLRQPILVSESLWCASRQPAILH